MLAAGSICDGAARSLSSPADNRSRAHFGRLSFATLAKPSAGAERSSGTVFSLWRRCLAGLYAVSAAVGLGFGGIIPSCVLAIRQLFPAAEAGWRIATLILFGLAGMAIGGWLGGAIYDWAAYYQPAFAVGVAVNLLNLVPIGALVARMPRRDSALSAPKAI
jgi:MFS family permease